ncbi:hypothetical protein D046_3324A, partial [Vibrio parahaemolyticus V-223/04]
MFDFVDAVDG